MWTHHFSTCWHPARPTPFDRRFCMWNASTHSGICFDTERAKKFTMLCTWFKSDVLTVLSQWRPNLALCVATGLIIIWHDRLAQPPCTARPHLPIELPWYVFYEITSATCKVAIDTFWGLWHPPVKTIRPTWPAPDCTVECVQVLSALGCAPTVFSIFHQAQTLMHHMV